MNHLVLLLHHLCIVIDKLEMVGSTGGGAGGLAGLVELGLYAPGEQGMEYLRKWQGCEGQRRWQIS